MSKERPQFFLVRLWSAPAGDGKVEWHGRLQHVISGEAHGFVGCPQLLEILLAMLPAEETEVGGDPSQPKLERR